MSTFSRTERVIYEYIQCNSHELSQISAKTIASKTFTTTTSVNRVCKKMGYSGYTELRYKLGEPQPNTENSEHCITDRGNKQLFDICQELNSGDHIYLYAKGATLTSLSYLSRFLSIAGIPHLALVDIHQLVFINKGILLLISLSGETTDILEMARNAKRKNIKTIAITRRKSSLSQISSHSWYIEAASDTSSIYKRETQLNLLHFIDEIGCQLLDASDI